MKSLFPSFNLASVRRVTIRYAPPALFSIGLGLAFTHCGGGSDSSSFNVPAVAPIVNSALPSNLRSSTTSASAVLRGPHALQNPAEILSAPNSDSERAAAALPTGRFAASFTPDNAPGSETANAIAFIKALFSNYYVSPNDGKGYQGYVNSLVVGVDGRMSGIKSQISSMKATCLTAAMPATAPVVGLGAIDPMAQFSVPYLQCNNVFSTGGGNVAGAGSGAAFGQSGTSFSLWLLLVASGGTSTTYDGTGGFLGVANVINANSTSASAPETVDGMLVSYSPVSSQNQITVSRFTASPATNSFALFVGSNQVNQQGFAGANVTAGNGATSNLGSGFRLISDGTHVYSDGVLLDTTNSNYYFYNVCLNASDLSLDATPADCATLSSSYVTTTWASLYPGLTTNPNPLSTSASLNYNAVTGCTGTTSLPTHASNTLAMSTGTTNACPAGGPPGNVTSNATTAPQAAILAALKTVALPTTLQNLGN